MLVYRVCAENEIKHLLDDKSFKNIVKKYDSKYKLNSHKYKEDKKYIHFFKNFDSIFYYAVTEGSYVCIYDIPEEILERSAGIGYYYDRIHLEKLEAVEEYAVEENDLDINYLKTIKRSNRFIDFEDYVYNNYKRSLITVFDRKKKRKTKGKYKVLQR